MTDWTKAASLATPLELGRATIKLLRQEAHKLSVTLGGKDYPVNGADDADAALDAIEVAKAAPKATPASASVTAETVLQELARRITKNVPDDHK